MTADLSAADGRPLVVMFSVEGLGEHLVWGTAVVRAGELHLATHRGKGLVEMGPG